MTPLHMGALHPVEQFLTLFFAFAPFVLLGVVVWVRRRQDAAAEETTAPAAAEQRSNEIAGS